LIAINTGFNSMRADRRSRRLVAEVKFSEWTTAGEMRHPSFLGLREDKKPKDVVLEKEVHRKG
jgi:ATP-dependent DNA ligase